MVSPITPFERRMRLVFGLVLSVLFSTVAVSILIITRLNDSLEWVSHTHEVVAAINATHVHFTSARVSGKNYLITRQPKYLAMRDLSREEFNERLSQVLMLTVDNARQQDNVDKTRVLADTMFNNATGFVNKLDNEHPNDTQIIDFTDTIEAEASKVIGHFQIMRDEEGRLLTERQKYSVSFVNQAYSIMPTMLLVQAALLIYIYYGVLDQCKSTYET